MQHLQLLEAVRNLVRRNFAELGMVEELEIAEHILLRDDIYCGRKFQAGRLQAIWFIEEDEIKFYATDGTVARVMSSSDAQRLFDAQHRHAA